MFFKILSNNNYSLLLNSYHNHSRIKIELDLLDRTLGRDYPIIKDITDHLRSNPSGDSINLLKLQLDYKYKDK